jgi:Holliday junction resolvase RusA-like endonuclease
MTQSFNIYAKLPSLNEYINSCRYNKYAAAGMKRTVENEVIQWVKAAHIRPVEDYPVLIKIKFYEPNKRTDADNIESRQKFILDSLQKAGILKGDSPKYLIRAPDKEIIYGKEIKKNSIRVEIIEGVTLNVE